MRSNAFQPSKDMSAKIGQSSGSVQVQKSDKEDFDYLQSKNDNLEKQNNNLTDQLNKYAILLREEKNEKIELISKYDALNKQHVTKIEEF